MGDASVKILLFHTVWLISFSKTLPQPTIPTARVLVSTAITTGVGGLVDKESLLLSIDHRQAVLRHHVLVPRDHRDALREALVGVRALQVSDEGTGEEVGVADLAAAAIEGEVEAADNEAVLHDTAT